VIFSGANGKSKQKSRKVKYKSAESKQYKFGVHVLVLSYQILPKSENFKQKIGKIPTKSCFYGLGLFLFEFPIFLFGLN
jgi:hypothetical protein